jgi:hypothetical protein
MLFTFINYFYYYSCYTSFLFSVLVYELFKFILLVDSFCKFYLLDAIDATAYGSIDFTGYPLASNELSVLVNTNFDNSIKEGLSCS